MRKSNLSRVHIFWPFFVVAPFKMENQQKSSPHLGFYRDTEKGTFLNNLMAIWIYNVKKQLVKGTLFSSFFAPFIYENLK
jgi:hypothetical protein